MVAYAEQAKFFSLGNFVIIPAKVAYCFITLEGERKMPALLYLVEKFLGNVGDDVLKRIDIDHDTLDHILFDHRLQVHLFFDAGYRQADILQLAAIGLQMTGCL